MTAEDNEKNMPPSNQVERHIQTLLLAAIVGLLAWNFNTTQNTQVELAALRTDVNVLKSTVAVATQNRYTNMDASAEHGRIWDRMDRLENRLERVEGVD